MDNVSSFSIGRGVPKISHLMFADDTILFFKTTTTMVQKVTRILNTYTTILGQPINFHKPSILFSPGTLPSKAHYLSSILQVQQPHFRERYLSVDLNFSQSKSKLFTSVCWRNKQGNLSLITIHFSVNFFMQSTVKLKISCKSSLNLQIHQSEKVFYGVVTDKPFLQWQIVAGEHFNIQEKWIPKVSNPLNHSLSVASSITLKVTSH